MVGGAGFQRVSGLVTGRKKRSQGSIFSRGIFLERGGYFAEWEESIFIFERDLGRRLLCDLRRGGFSQKQGSRLVF